MSTKEKAAEEWAKANFGHQHTMHGADWRDHVRSFLSGWTACESQKATGSDRERAEKIVGFIRALDGCVGGYEESIDIVSEALAQAREETVEECAKTVETCIETGRVYGLPEFVRRVGKERTHV